MRLLILSTLLFVIYGCSPGNSSDKEGLLKYFYINYDIELVSEVLISEDTLVYLPSLSDSVYTLKYIYSKDTIHYILKADSDFQPKYIVNPRDTSNSFIYVDHLNFKINDRTYLVYKYANNFEVIDGCVTHFWTPEIGVILTRSSTWRSFRKLQTNNDSINKEINLLAEQIYQDVGFYFGCTSEMELMSTSDAEEYRNEKYKGMNVESQVNDYIKNGR